MSNLSHSSDSELPLSNDASAPVPLNSVAASRNFPGIEEHDSEAMIRASFLSRVLQQTDRLREMLDSGQLERMAPGVFRAGLEIENFLLHGKDGLAADSCNALLQKLKEAGDKSQAWTSEMAEKMIEYRTEPFLLNGKALSELEANLKQSNQKLDNLADDLGVRVLSSGTLPTERLDNLTLEHLAFNEAAHKRFARCNSFAKADRGDVFEINIGPEDKRVSFELDSLMAAGSICSIQPHLQCDPDNFVTLFNLSVALSGHVMAPSVGSPLVLGKEADAESRIALLEQAWERGRVYMPKYIARATEPFEENVFRHKPVFCDIIDAGKNSNSLPELQIQNGTIHRWVRPIYGETSGLPISGEVVKIPHIRIEFRPLAAYPAPIDNVANSAWYWGLVQGMKLYMEKNGISDVSQIIPEEEAMQSFESVARLGLKASIYDPLLQKHAPADEVTLRLSDLAREGLLSMGLDQHDVEQYLDVVLSRARSGKTLSHWIVERQKDLNSGASDNSDGQLSANQILALELAEARRNNTPIHLL